VHADVVTPALAPEQRRHRRDEGAETAHDGRLIVGQGERRPRLGTDQLDEAGERAAHRVACLEVAIGTRLAEPRQVDGDEMGMGGGLIAARRIDQHVGAGEELVEVDLVRRDALLAEIQIGEPAALAVDQRGKGSTGISGGRLDLDHLGTEVGEQAGGIGAGRKRTELDHAKGGKARLGHP
jgi:hypothetical protein